MEVSCQEREEVPGSIILSAEPGTPPASQMPARRFISDPYPGPRDVPLSQDVGLTPVMRVKA